MNISIIIPVYNASLYLRECLDSVITQSFDKEYEVIVVNDGSTDNSLEICREYASRFPNVIVLTEENAGVSAARNKAIAVAKGDWLVFLDADDKLLPGALTTLHERARMTGADLVLANAVKLIDSKTTSPILRLSNETIPNAINHIKHFALWGYLIPADVVRRENLRFVEGLAYSEDRVFLYQLARYCHTIAYTESPVYIYRIHPSSACQSIDGVRKAKHHFMAANHLLQIADSYHDVNRQTYKLLSHEASHAVDLGIYLFLQQPSSFRQIHKVKKDFDQYLPRRCDWTAQFYMLVVKNYLTIQRRRLITIKKQQ